MCGIGGIINLGADRETIMNSVASLLRALEPRGRDASGIAAIYKDKEFVLKRPVQPNDFINNNEFKAFLKEHSDAKVFMVHARNATQGSPSHNQNNHPLESKNFILVHNGVIHDDALNGLFESENVDPTVQTDSYLILKAAEKFGIETAMRLKGSNACIVYDRKKKLLHLFRLQMPLVAGYCQQLKLLVFASTEEAIQKAFTKSQYLFNLIEINKHEYEYSSGSLQELLLYTCSPFSEIYFKTVPIDRNLHSVDEGEVDRYIDADVYIINNTFYVKFKEKPKKKFWKAVVREFDIYRKFVVIPPDKWDVFMGLLEQYYEKKEYKVSRVNDYYNYNYGYNKCGW